jgi:predicted RecB family nuclease
MRLMNPPLTDDVLRDFLKCPYKAYLKLRGEAGDQSDFERSQHERLARYKAAARERVRQGHALDAPPSLPEAIQSGASLILNSAACDAGQSCRFDALEREGSGSNVSYRPVQFVFRDRVTAHDRLSLAFAASILARVQGTTPTVGKIVHGPGFKVARVELPNLARSLGETIGHIHDVASAAKPPTLVLNRHCGECEFRQRCRATAIEKDDLSLLAGLSAREVAALNARGICTITQLSHNFRPARLKRAKMKHDRSLQALAIREKTVYVAKRPEVADAKAVIYLDVEGLPDEDFYYLIGLLVVQGESRRQLSFWADSRSDEGTIWTAFLAAVASVEGFVLFHYGSYESKFLERMAERHGGDSCLVAMIKDRSVNVLSLVFAQVYFPVYANDLKSVAGCLGFSWSTTDASGLRSIAWRHSWEDTRNESQKQLLLRYNGEDCSALEVVVQMLRSIGAEGNESVGYTGPRVASVEEAQSPYRYRFGTPRFAIPELARITKCAYFDYQRDKVLCRTSRRKRAVTHSGKRRKKQTWKVNREVEWGKPAACPHCGSTGIDQQGRFQKLVIDLKPIGGGIKRQVTRHKTKRYRCRKCLGTFLPEGYLAVGVGYGRGLCGWVVYASIALRQTNEAVAEALLEMFGVDFGRGYPSRIRRRAVDRYRPTYEALLAALRGSHVAHADETKVQVKGTLGHGYVWAFASPTLAVYVFAPTRDGVTARETLTGFTGILVSDFYAAYDSLACPQQKCLIHLIRDFNDDLLRNPFDSDLKQQAARFTALLQTVIATVDRFGLKKYHLHKHKKDVDRYYDIESGAAYGSELARHYQQRVLKYRAKLFTFLDYDDVPWNNNNAENAIKQFACRRATMGTTFTEAGIRDYLLLLSIYQTLRYRKASFWKFLRSGETDIDAFTGSRR